jgi:hypothetical protein
MNEQELKQVAAKTATPVSAVKATAEAMKARGIEPTKENLTRRIRREKDMP